MTLGHPVKDILGRLLHQVRLAVNRRAEGEAVASPFVKRVARVGVHLILMWKERLHLRIK